MAHAASNPLMKGACRSAVDRLKQASPSGRNQSRDGAWLAGQFTPAQHVSLDRPEGETG
jgi:hypothetical protein